MFVFAGHFIFGVVFYFSFKNSLPAEQMKTILEAYFYTMLFFMFFSIPFIPFVYRRVQATKSRNKQQKIKQFSVADNRAFP